jgi:very-short-patch-repair endonuclease
VDDRAVRLHKVPNGVYDRGKSRTNRVEAEAVVAEAVSRMRGWLALPEKERPTLGIITFNTQQQALIDDLLEQAQQAEPALEWFFSDERVEPTIVKNLENVQGDERDVILFSVTFWKDAAGKLTMDFGALNRDGGERRLNVAVTRARQELIIFSGFTADQIDTTRTKATGAHHLKAFLDYAERGAIALPAQDEGSMGSYESLFEEAVAEQLEQRGWTVVPQVGVSGFRIDLGIRHPDNAGVYLAGVECDGATYHSSATARDRDKVREQVLRGLGWTILRVWSTDWWFNARDCTDQLHADLEALLQKSRDERAAEEEAFPDIQHEPETDDTENRDSRSEIQSAEDAPLESAPPAEQMNGAVEPESPCYRVTDLSGFEVDPDRFHDFDYRATLQGMIDRVVDTESPLKTDTLAQRIARAHGWQRTGQRIRDRIDLHLRDLDRTTESSGEFIWKAGGVRDILPFRQPVDEAARRSIPDIPLAELASVVVDNPALLDEPDAARELAILLKVERLTAISRARLNEAIDHARQHLNTVQ